ncbi:MAG: biotin transporter BioY [Clostridia bacterium]|nr:biotin transporter BioY [Clostridia bacterium]
MNSRIKSTAFVGLMAAMIAAISVWQIPLPFLTVPLTFQTFAVCLSGSALGKWRGAVSVLVYIALGCIGLPVFTGFQGGAGVMAGPTGGFIVGFLPLAFFAGLGKEKKLFWRIALCVPGLILCHLFGVLWYSFVTDVGIGAAFLTSSLGFIIKDLCFALLAVLLSRTLEKRKII